MDKNVNINDISGIQLFTLMNLLNDFEKTTLESNNSCFLFYDTNKLVLTNTENCSFKDLISTIESINTLISNKFDICLDVEPEIIT